MWYKATFTIFLISALSTIWYVLEMDRLNAEVIEQRRIITVLQDTSMLLHERVYSLEHATQSSKLR